MIIYCPECGEETNATVIHEKVDVNIRGTLIPVEVDSCRCNNCGEVFEKRKKDSDPLQQAYREYRRQKGLLQPEEIKQLRKKYGLSQKQMSKLIGIGIATLNRYENGALQSDGHDRAIRLVMQPENLAKRLKEDENLLPDPVRKRILQQVEQQDHRCDTLTQHALDQFGSYAPSIDSGYQPLRLEKLTQAVKFFCLGTGTLKTILMKLLFYADFKHYRENGISITGLKYVHLPYGPVPDQYATWLTVLTEWEHELALEERTFGEYSGEVYLSPDVDLSCFSSSELQILIQVKTSLSQYSAKQISAFSHEEPGYQATQNGEVISYEYAEKLRI